MNEKVASNGEAGQTTEPAPCGVIIEGTVLIGIDASVTSIVIGPEVDEIAEDALCQAMALEDIIFKGRLCRVGARAFLGLPRLRTVRFEGDIRQIDDDAMRGCELLEHVEFGGSLTQIGDRVFQDCVALENMVFPDHTEIMGKGMFSGCESLEHVHLPRALKVIPVDTFANCILLESIDWPEECCVEGVNYPIAAPFAFRGCLADDYQEIFELDNGVMQRALVDTSRNDPTGLFNMMFPGEMPWIDLVPQRMVNAILNHAWESSSNSRQHDIKMQVFQICLGLVSMLVVREKGDTRAERLAVLHQLMQLFMRIPKGDADDVRSVLPYAISTALHTIGGNGKSRRAMDDVVAQLFEPYREEYAEVQQYRQTVGDVQRCEQEAVEETDASPIFKALGIGPDIPFRYDTTRTFDVFAMPADFDDYYLFARAMESLAEHRLDTQLKCNQDLSRLPQSEWYSEWTKIIHVYDANYALAVFEPTAAMSHDCADLVDMQAVCVLGGHSVNTKFVAILHLDQVDAIRKLLVPFNLEDIFQVYTYSLELV